MKVIEFKNRKKDLKEDVSTMEFNERVERLEQRQREEFEKLYDEIKLRKALERFGATDL